jgi:hypothetical protein
VFFQAFFHSSGAGVLFFEHFFKHFSIVPALSAYFTHFSMVLAL